ncbi:hypothetical protein RDI58_017591 [Solanum bulbocastanum]|uniref:Uncharacterized protein n=1 Tax=Solanum bulbocastanum TaxID=147425 RepID=A0AAN8Y9C1_SOLBU
MIAEGDFPSGHYSYQHIEELEGSFNDKTNNTIHVGRSAAMEALHALVYHQEGKIIPAEHWAVDLVKEASGGKEIKEYFEGENESNMLQGDFNVILGEEEKIDGLPVYLQKYDDFVECLTSSGLDDVNFSGNPFTWWNGRADGYNIWQELPDHAPLLLSCVVNNGAFRPFKFLNFLTKKEDLGEVVEHNWVEDALEEMFVQFK